MSNHLAQALFNSGGSGNGGGHNFYYTPNHQLQLQHQLNQSLPHFNSSQRHQQPSEGQQQQQQLLLVSSAAYNQ
jgi:hypothetical protein